MPKAVDIPAVAIAIFALGEDPAIPPSATEEVMEFAVEAQKLF